MRELLREALRRLHAGQPVALAVTLESLGSTPVPTGARMALFGDGTLLGSVGGGPAEAEVQRLAPTLAPGTCARLRFRLDARSAAEAGMVCGGTQQMLVERLDDAGAATLARALERLEDARPCLLVTAWAGEGGPVAHRLEEAAVASAAELVETGLRAEFREPLRPPERLYIFGAGHVGRATAHLAASVGFCVVLVDDRPDFADPALHPGAAVVLAEDPARACARLPIGCQDFVLIVTRGHAQDREVLSCALRTQARFVGMIGSRRKRDAVLAALGGEGFSAAELERVHCPVGLAIAAKTAAEIAVSIVAQLISVRAGAADG